MRIKLGCFHRSWVVMSNTSSNHNSSCANWGPGLISPIHLHHWILCTIIRCHWKELNLNVIDGKNCIQYANNSAGWRLIHTSDKRLAIAITISSAQREVDIRLLSSSWSAPYIWNNTISVWSGYYIKITSNVNISSASGCVVECRICNWEVAGLNLGLGYFASRSTQPSIPPGSVNEYQL